MDVHPPKNGIYRYWPIPTWNWDTQGSWVTGHHLSPIAPTGPTFHRRSFRTHSSPPWETKAPLSTCTKYPPSTMRTGQDFSAKRIYGSMVAGPSNGNRTSTSNVKGQSREVAINDSNAEVYGDVMTFCKIFPVVAGIIRCVASRIPKSRLFLHLTTSNSKIHRFKLTSPPIIDSIVSYR